jgi:transcriptional regulator with XRE-family HTH domain
VTNALPDVQRERQLGPDSIGEALRLLRHRARLTRDALAKESGVSAGAISNYENDVSAPSAATLRRLALVLAAALETDALELWQQLGDVLDRQGRATSTE